MSWIKEEVLFRCLYWLSPVTSALVVMMEWLEATYHIEDPLMVFYRVVQNKRYLQHKVVEYLCWVVYDFGSLALCLG